MDFVTQIRLSTQLIDVMSFVEKWIESIVADKLRWTKIAKDCHRPWHIGGKVISLNVAIS